MYVETISYFPHCFDEALIGLDFQEHKIHEMHVGKKAEK